jgi:outer membrane receptor protein involved in Fe transport
MKIRLHRPYIFGLAAYSLAFAFAPPAIAQDGIGAGQLDDTIDEIIVTGSRIKRANFDSPQPVTVFDREYLADAGIKDITDFERFLPQSHQTLNESHGQYATEVPEASQFNLRGLGLDSTLTLIDGKRIAPYGQSISGQPFTDISAIPVSAIERIEILKDGASAIYGADAMAGVVNIILRKDYSGTEASVGYDVTSRGDGAEWNVNVFHGGQRGAFHYMLGLSLQDRDPIYSRDREWSADPDFSDVGGYNTRSFASSPPTVFRYDTFLFEADPACGTDPQISNVDLDPEWGDSYCMFNHNYFDTVQIGRQRVGVNLRAGYEFDGGIHFFADVLYSTKESTNDAGLAPVYGGGNLSTFIGAPLVLADHPNNPFDTDVEIFSRPMDVGPRRYVATADQYRVTLGLEGSIADWHWSASVLDSANSQERLQPNALNIVDYQEALLGRGGPNQDQYYNPFGWLPENDPAVIDGFMTTAWNGNETAEQSIDIDTTTTIGALGGRPVGLALGAQWRYQELEEFADAGMLSGQISGSYREYLIEHADRTIGAIYAEMNLPLTEDVELQLAARFEDYSDFGNTTNPKVAMRWQLADPLALRASWGTSFHAPDFLELYQAPAEFIGYVVDTPRCELTGLDADCRQAPYNVIADGNPDLQPELGDSWYGGLIWTPTFAPGFAADIGYWRFDFEDRIAGLGGQFMLDNLPADNPFVERAPPTPEEAAAGIPGRIIRLRGTRHNLAEDHSDGWDMDLSYRRSIFDQSELGARLYLTYTDSLKFTLPERFELAEYSVAGEYWNGPIPRVRGNLQLGWSTGAHDLSAVVNYAGSYQNFWEFLPVDGEESDIPFIVDSHYTVDLQYAVALDQLNDAELRIGCRNCTDKAPPFTHTTWGENIHDQRGLTWYANWTQPF